MASTRIMWKSRVDDDTALWSCISIICISRRFYHCFYRGISQQRWIFNQMLFNSWSDCCFVVRKSGTIPLWHRRNFSDEYVMLKLFDVNFAFYVIQLLVKQNWSHIYIYIYNSVLTCRPHIINSSASAPPNATKIAVKRGSDVVVCMFGPEL